MSAIDHPAHYQLGGIEVVDVMEAWALPQHGSHCLKYIARAGRKPGSSREQDLRKALWWCERALSTGRPLGAGLWGAALKPADVARAWGLPVLWLEALGGDQPARLAAMLRVELAQQPARWERRSWCMWQRCDGLTVHVHDDVVTVAHGRRSSTHNIELDDPRAWADSAWPMDGEG